MINSDKKDKAVEFLEKLEDDDDVQNVFINTKFGSK